jgi:GMP synthase (glutamine-hydrolysing)
MRKGESARVLERFQEMGLGENLHFVDASDTFLQALAGAVDPEEKRRVIGDTFVRVFQEKARELKIEDHLLGQGTIYPDTIETGGTRRADLIKTHHNRVPIIQKMVDEGKVVEPLAELYKVEVRELGERLGIARELLWRHPFPGPGLGVRLLCNTGEPDRTGFDVAEPILDQVARPFGLDALLLPIRSVGVKADLRAYEHPVLLSGEASWNRLLEAASAVTKEVPGINRCIWNLAPGAPVSARPMAATVTRERLDLLREADNLVMAALRRHGLYDEIWQCPTVLVPLQLGNAEGELVVVRPILSERAMTARPYPLPRPVLDDLRREILALDGVSGLALDITSKPPGTIEWE